MARRKRFIKDIDTGFKTLDDIYDTGTGYYGDREAASPMKVEQLGPEVALPCKVCGRYPRLHVADFFDKKAHPKQFYVDCGACSNCDGEWYATSEEAIAAWNRMNEGAVPKADGVKDEYDEFDDIMNGKY